MKLAALRTLFLALVLWSASPSAKANNLLVNGGFNDLGFPYPSDLNLVLAPWQWNGSIGYTWNNGGIAIGPGVTLDSGGCVGLSGGSIYQDVPTIPGQIYELTITAHARGSVSGTYIQPLWGNTQLPLGFAKYFEWNEITYQVQATESITRLSLLTAPNNAGPTWMDSVVLEIVPEPSVLAIALLGGAVLMKRRQITHTQLDLRPFSDAVREGST